MSCRTSRSYRGGLALALAGLLLAPPAAAAERDPFTRHFESAAALYKSKQYEEAIAELQAAYAIRQLPRVLLNLGHAYRKLGRARDALRSYQQFLRVEPNPAPDLKRELDAYIEQTQALLEAGQPPPPAQPGQPAQASPTPAPAPGPGEAPSPALSVAPAAASQQREAPQRTPVYKKWWLWTTVGAVAAVGLGVGLGVGLTQQPGGTVFPGVSF